MMIALPKYSNRVVQVLAKNLHTTSVVDKAYKLAIVGGGAGGCSAAAKFTRKLGKGAVAVIEPADMHYYQPMWTLVGGGVKQFEQSGKKMSEVLPKNADWYKEKAVKFDPENNQVHTEGGNVIEYEYLVVATGLQLDYHKIKGLPEAFETPGVGSNYSRNYVRKTWKAVQDFKEGNCLFTFPNTPVKCAGAPQKIMYLTEKTLRETNRRDKADIHFFSSLGVLFGVKKYADALWKVVEERNINVHLKHNLIEVRSDTKEAVFQNLDKPEEAPKVVPYSLLHITPPMSPPPVLATGGEKFVDGSGYLNVNKETLQHVNYKNVFGIGDSTNIPTSKTAAAVAGQLPSLKKNLEAVMKGRTDLNVKYNGYTSCPLITGRDECILAEFDFSVPPKPMETFPFNQGKPRRSMYFLKANLMPQVYWQMLNGFWDGPQKVRKLTHLGMAK